MKHFKQLKSIFQGELSAYFNSPIAYIFIIVFVALTAGLYMTNFFLIGNADMRYFFGLLPVILCVFIPAVTMRVWAEEKKGNTFEMLLTFPMASYKIVLGKFFAAFVFYLIALAGTVFIPLMLFFTGKPDLGPIIGGYLGACFVGAFFLSVGIFISGLSKDQIIAFIVSMMICFFFFLSGTDFMAEIIDGWMPGVGSFLKTNFGMTRHFSSFQKGVIDNRDVLYFFIMTGAFLLLNIFAIEDRMRPKAKLFFTAAAGICLVISIIFNSLVFDIPMGRFDLTEGKIYTITQSAKQILRKLKAPVTVKLYISPKEKMPTAFKTLEQDIRDRLEELKIASNGKLSFKTFYMEAAQQTKKDEEEKSFEERLQQKGINPFQVQSIDEDEVGIKIIYSAAAIAYKEKKEEIIPRIIPSNVHNLEYELMSKIYRMTLDKKPLVALAAPYEEKTIDAQALAFLRQLGQIPARYKEDKFNILEALLGYEGYDLKRIRLTKEEPLPQKTDTLIVVSPENLNERQRYEINRFLYEGGNVIIAAQKYAYDYHQARGGVSITPRKNNLGINDLLSNYGAKISDKLLMDKNHEVLSISGSMNIGPFALSVPVKAPMHILISRDNLNQDISITGRLSPMLYLWGSSLELDKDKLSDNKLKQTVLFSSSEDSWQVPYRGISLKQSDVEGSGKYEAFPLAVLLEGQFPNAFAEKTIPDWPKKEGEEKQDEDEEKDEQAPVLSAKPGKLIVIGCSTMFEENFIQKGGAANFFINCVDAVTLGGELINIRSHQPIDRRIKKLEKGEKLWYRFLTVALVPIIMIILGGIRAFLRRKDKEQYLSLLNAE